MEAPVNYVATPRIWPETVAFEKKVRLPLFRDLGQIGLNVSNLPVIDPTTVLGTGREAGADEDDFHTFKRRTTEVERDEKQETT